MTVIISDGRSMVGDGLVACGSTIVQTTCKKITRLRDGSLIGTSGKCSDEQAVIHYFNNGGDRPEVEGSDGLLLRPNGDLFWFGESLQLVKMQPPYAIGSGQDYVLAAYDACGDLRRAVEITSQRCTSVGGEIQVEKI